MMNKFYREILFILIWHVHFVLAHIISHKFTISPNVCDRVYKKFIVIKYTLTERAKLDNIITVNFQMKLTCKFM